MTDRYPEYADDEKERLCPYTDCGKAIVELDESYEGKCPACGRNVTFEGPEEETP